MFRCLESPGISVFPAKYEVLQLMMNSIQGGTSRPVGILSHSVFFPDESKNLGKDTPCLPV